MMKGPYCQRITFPAIKSPPNHSAGSIHKALTIITMAIYWQQ